MMTSVKRALYRLLMVLGAAAIAAPLYAQGVTTGSMTGVATDPSRSSRPSKPTTPPGRLGVPKAAVDRLTKPDPTALIVPVPTDRSGVV